MSQSAFVYGIRGARRVGRRDGRSWRWVFFPFKKEPKDAQPPANQTMPAEYEQEVKGGAKSHLAGLAGQWQKEDERLYTEYVAALRDYDTAGKSLKKEADEAERAIRQHEKARDAVADLGLPSMSRRARDIWLLAFAIFEYPLNKAVFQIFQLNWFDTALVAASVGIMVPGLAHLTGYKLRQEVKGLWDKILLWVGALGALAVIGAIAYARSTYLQAENQLQVLGIHFNPATMTVVFIVVNMGIFIIAMIISYHGSHPRGEQFRQATRGLKEAVWSLRKETGEADQAQRQFEMAAKAVDLARSRREARFEVWVRKAQLIIQSYENQVHAYRRANLEARPASTRPRCFNADPVPVVLPPAFNKLNWGTGGVAATAPAPPTASVKTAPKPPATPAGGEHA